jgi:chromosome segregation ATPase
VETGLSFRSLVKLRPSPSFLKLIVVFGACSLLGTGCVAQQADLARIQKDLELQITKIKEEKRALGEQVNEAKSAISESQNLLRKQKAEIAKMQSDLAPRTDFAGLNQQLKLIREQDLAMLHGKNEVIEKRLNDFEKSFNEYADSTQAQIGSLQTTVQAQGDNIQIQSDQIQSAQAQTSTLAQQVDENNKALTGNMTEFQSSLAKFKETLASLGTTIGQVQTDLTTQRQALGSLESRTEDLSGSVLQIQGVLEKSGNLFNTRLEEQSDQVTQLQDQVITLQDKLNTDTQALRTYLEKDVNTAMARLVEDIDRKQEPVLAQIDSLQKDMEILGTHVQADAAHVQDLSQSVIKLREAQEVMGSLLGKRGDEIIQQAGRLSERINTVESHQAALTDQVQSNTQKTSTHLEEVNTSLKSISQALDQTSQSLSSRLAKQEEAAQKFNQTVEQFQQLKQDTQDQIHQMQSAGQLTDELRQTVEQIRSRLQDLEIHQSGLVGKLDSDAQATNTHLQEVNSGIKSVAQALETVSGKLNARIDDQEQRLNRAMTSFQRVQGTADTSQTNLAHLNQLTETVNQLRDVVNTIGIKLGERVDQHEDRLGQLAQRVNRLQNPKQKN